MHKISMWARLWGGPRRLPVKDTRGAVYIHMVTSSMKRNLIASHIKTGTIEISDYFTMQ